MALAWRQTSSRQNANCSRAGRSLLDQTCRPMPATVRAQLPVADFTEAPDGRVGRNTGVVPRAYLPAPSPVPALEGMPLAEVPMLVMSLPLSGSSRPALSPRRRGKISLSPRRPQCEIPRVAHAPGRRPWGRYAGMSCGGGVGAGWARGRRLGGRAGGRPARLLGRVLLPDRRLRRADRGRPRLERVPRPRRVLARPPGHGAGLGPVRAGDRPSRRTAGDGRGVAADGAGVRLARGGPRRGILLRRLGRAWAGDARVALRRRLRGAGADRRAGGAATDIAGDAARRLGLDRLLAARRGAGGAAGLARGAPGLRRPGAAHGPDPPRHPGGPLPPARPRGPGGRAAHPRPAGPRA